ncbi:MAG: hsp70 family protein [Deltaproteobacteria bacterium]|nr:hsp70 family protein [Deltaproteobacteria bacterium]
MSGDSRYIVGIDLGTTHTVVAYVRTDAAPGSAESKPRIFELDQLVAPGEIEKRALLASLRYQPAEGELAADAIALPWELAEVPGSSGPYVVGELARTLGSKVPGRLVVSAKSWLSHAAVDRTAAILPWGAPSDVHKVSPVVASASYLAHVADAWDHAHPGHELADQEIVLTIPASFDEGARALTLEAARLAGLPRVRLLEEPQAAFYDWLGQREDVAAAVGSTRLALVVDVGGGTTDLTFIRVEMRESGPRLSRIAVGDHLMLGGDNMDLLLAREAEARLGGKLPSARFTQLLAQCRGAKEELLARDAPESVRVTVLGSGSRLIESALSTELERAHTLERLVEGFFPIVDLDARPQKRASAIIEFGLPYVADAAVTRHVAAFLARHQSVARDAVGDALIDGVALPDAVLLNGGVFRGQALADRMIDVLSRFRGDRGPVRVLDNDDPELAVARGAVFYGLARRGVGMRIGGGSARSYFLLLGDRSKKSDDGVDRAVCLLPRGAEEGEEVVLGERAFTLRLGQPVRFHLASSVGQAAYVRPGEIVELTDDPTKDEPVEGAPLRLERDLFRALPPIAAVLDDARASDADPKKPREARVTLAAMLTEIGTLEMSCLAEGDRSRRWNLELQLRGGEGDGSMSLPAQRVTQLHPRYQEAKARVELVFGKSESSVEAKPQKTLRQDLEKILGPRAEWATPLLRELWGALFAGVKRRRRSDDHERVWFNLVGYSLRPGFGYPLDDWRVKQLFELFDQGVQFAPEAQNWSEWWTLWRRVAGGLDAAQQTKILAALDYYLHPPTTRPRPRPSGPRAQGYDDMVRLAASLERVSASDKERVGGWLLERLTKHGEGASSWWAIGRIGARVPFYGSAHTVVGRTTAEAWLGAVLALDWKLVEPAALAAMQLSRASGDRQRDVDDTLRAEVIRRLAAHGAPPAWIELVREPRRLEAETAQRVLGESLPPGLELVE